MTQQFTAPPNPQGGSPLFSVLPGEIRDRIFNLTLTSFQSNDTTVQYEDNTCYRRPGYLAPSRTDCALLQTCQLVYNESHHRAWANAQHTFWLTVRDRAPAAIPQGGVLIDRPDYHKTLEEIHVNHYRRLRIYSDSAFEASSEEASGVADNEECKCMIERENSIQLNNVRIFAQLWQLEPGESLRNIYRQRFFWPRCVTITLRHHDWWFWETDEWLAIRPSFVNRVRLPHSVVEFRMELESLQRKKVQVDYMATEMAQNWFLTRGREVDCAVNRKEVHSEPQVIMRARPEDFETSTWEGTSTWANQRWVRDETDDKPGLLTYYIKTVVWKPDRSIPVVDRPLAKEIAVPKTLQKQIPSTRTDDPYLHVNQMRRAAVPEGSTATEAREAVWAHRARVQARVGTAELQDQVNNGLQNLQNLQALINAHRALPAGQAILIPPSIPAATPNGNATMTADGQAGDDDEADEVDEADEDDEDDQEMDDYGADNGEY